MAANWRKRLAEPDTLTEVVAGPGRLTAFWCVRGDRLEHLAVHPDDWGRGLAREAVARAVAAITAAGRQPVLWCLVGNVRARGLYEHLGWVLSGRTTRSRYPPYHDEVEYVLRSRSG